MGGTGHQPADRHSDALPVLIEIDDALGSRRVRPRLPARFLQGLPVDDRTDFKRVSTRRGLEH